MSTLIGASWVWSGDADRNPLPDGGVLVEGRRVVAVGPIDALREAHPEAGLQRHEGVLLPGLVNARVSLELSGLRGAVPGGRGYVPWLRELTNERERRAPEGDAEAIGEAVDALIEAGTAAIGEVTRTGAAIGRLASAPLLARVFHEVAGLRRETATVIRAMAEEQLEGMRTPANVSLALAPHSLVGLHPSALAALFEGGAPIPLPVAGSPAERAFLADGGGPLAEWMRERGADAPDWDPPGLAPVAYGEALGVLGPSLAATHLTDARDDELAALAERGAEVVLCPRASLHVEAKPPPLPALLAAGLTPGLGTDSLAAASSVDVLDEALALHRRFPAVAPRVLCAMATSFGARALGLEERVGRLAPGLAPGLVLFEGRGVEDPLSHVLTSGCARRVLVRPGAAL